AVGARRGRAQCAGRHAAGGRQTRSLTVAFTRGFDGDEQPMAEINTTPLVDVMLVLLVIFIVTAPLLTHGVRVDLPRVRAAPATEAPASVVLSLDASGALRIDGEIVGESQLPQRLAAFA